VNQRPKLCRDENSCVETLGRIGDGNWGAGNWDYETLQGSKVCGAEHFLEIKTNKVKLSGGIGDGNSGVLQTPSMKLCKDPNSGELNTLWR
jgi:hypothetical protein